MTTPLMPSGNVSPGEEPTPILSPEETSQRDATAVRETQRLKEWYREAHKALKTASAADLADDSLWENASTAKGLSEKEFKLSTNQERNLAGQNEVEASLFRQARIEALKDKKLEKILDDIAEEKPSTKDRIAKLIAEKPEDHRKLWEKSIGM